MNRILSIRYVIFQRNKQMYRNVKLENGIFTAKDEMDRDIIIVEHISFIYTTHLLPETGAVMHKPVTYKEHKVLAEIEKFLKGKRFKPEILESVTIRYGWLDKRLEKTEFVNITDFIQRFRNKTQSPTDKSKFTAVLNQLSISKRDIA